jgi:hypothetical protein
VNELRLSRRLVLLALVATAGCGARGATFDTVAGRRSFDVVASLSPAPGAAMPTADLPGSVRFTLVLDGDANDAIAGAKGTASVVPAASAGGGEVRLRGVDVGLEVSQCGGATTITFDSLVVGVSGGTLSGSGSGAAHVSCGDCTFDVPFSAQVSGVADVTPPVLLPGGVLESPFQAFTVAASEPLPATAKARLVGSDGSHVDLVPSIVDGAVPLVRGFTKPDVVLATGVGFAVALDGLVDFAGLQGSAATPLRLGSFAVPPLAPQDGFESVTSSELGGATVIDASAAPLAPIAGAHSLYFGTMGAPAPPGLTVGTALRVRLAVQPGDSKLRFSYRMLASSQFGGFSGAINVGSVGGTPAQDHFPLPPAATGMTWPDGSTVYVTDVFTEEIALPAGTTDEVLLSIDPFDSGCGGPTGPTGGILLDDLRVE